MPVHPVIYHDRVILFHGDSSALPLPPGSVDAIITDPPAGIGFMGKGWDKDKGGRDNWIAWLSDTLAPALAALKPGGHVLCWAIPRTSHWTATALENAGLQIRDVVTHLFGTGFPKSLNVSKAIDKHVGAEREIIGENPNHRAVSGVEYDGVYTGRNTGAAQVTAPGSPEAQRWDGWGTALKPACEYWILARKPLDGTVAENVMAHGTGAINVDGCRLTPGDSLARPRSESDAWPGKRLPYENKHGGRWPAHLVLSHHADCVASGQAIAKGAPGQGLDYAPRPDAIVTRYACVPECPVRQLDASVPASKSTKSKRPKGKRGSGFVDTGADKGTDTPNGDTYADAGGPSRFFYVTKPSRKEKDAGCGHLTAKTGGEATGRVDGSAGTQNPRAGAGRTGGAKNSHPTVKSIELMRWLIRLITPPGGVVLDPFCGSASTGVAALAEGMDFIGVEMTDEYVPIAKARLEHALGSQ